MIKKIEIQNYKSIEKLDFEIGRFNVFIGENGCGKTNILEALAFGSSADDLVKLAMKGVRITEPKYFRTGFDNSTLNEVAVYFFDSENNKIGFSLTNNENQYANWESVGTVNDVGFEEKFGEMSKDIRKLTSEVEQYKNLVSNILDEIKENPNGFHNADSYKKKIESYSEIRKELNGPSTHALRLKNILDKIISFLVYAPENYFLRNYAIESPYMQPLGSKGEGLLKLIKVIKKEKPEEYKEIIENLHLIDWFSDIEISEDSISGTEFKIADVYLEEGIGGFDIKNANEGFFLILFYVTLFVSDYTPSFFAIDNIDTALNPKLCTKLIEILTDLAKKHNKQVMITAHNPAILDGINLDDDEQRLFVVARNNDGYTRVRRIEKKPPLEGEKSMKLSEQFLRGYIGGLPKNF